MMGKRKRYLAEFKAKVAMEALRAAWCMDRLVGAERLGRVEAHLLS